VSEIFDEVNEELRREQLRKIWQRYGGLIVGAAVLVVVAVGGWRGYEYWQARQAAAAGSAFESAALLAEQNKHAEAAAAFTKLAETAPLSYRTLARLRAAGELAAQDPQAAVKIYDGIVADGSVGVENKDLAALRAGMLLLDKVPYADLRSRLEPLSEKGRIYRHSAREYLALSAWHGNDAAATRRWIDMITTDEETPASVRQRIEALQALLPPAAKG
jgi:hypothetical protein